MKKFFLVLTNGAFMPSSSEPYFNNMKVDQTLMNEIKGLGGLNENQELYIHYMIKKIIGYAELGFIKGTRKISVLDISWLGTYGECPETCQLHHIGKYDNMCYVKLRKDIDACEGRYLPKGTIIGTLNEDPFPAVKNPYIYRELLDPDNYGAPHYVLDFVNKKINEALPGRNLWAKADDLEFLSIYDLDILPHMKTY